MKIIERVVVDECLGHATKLLANVSSRLGDRPIEFVFLANEYAESGLIDHRLKHVVVLDKHLPVSAGSLRDSYQYEADFGIYS